ncbi:5-formyltetrahydrofolate cyclo-ligase [Tepidibacillus marianensis]|uniref:5-formyltetrahydrofolate cyclo-ligase n=1 Tax=Tepidibacillus marianensis TaxID=3131995 RepID=UPI0030CB8914
MGLSKQSLRQYFTERRNQLTKEDVRESSEVIIERLLHHPIYQKSNIVMAYLAFRHEVDLTPLIEQAWIEGKQILIPKTDRKSKQMEPYRMESWDEVKEGNYGILEPVQCDKSPFSLHQIELVLVPGLAFDEEGYRLGYGGGFYDRFFDRFTNLPHCIGIAYDFQYITYIPRDKHDYPMKEICTEKGCTKL